MNSPVRNRGRGCRHLLVSQNISEENSRWISQPLEPSEEEDLLRLKAMRQAEFGQHAQVQEASLESLERAGSHALVLQFVMVCFCLIFPFCYVHVV